MRNPCPQRHHAVSWLLAASLLAVAAAPAHAQWKWRDKNGQITASDLPPPRDVADKDVLQRPAAATARANVAPAVAASAPAPAMPASAPVDRELEARKQASEQDKKAKAKADEARLASQRADNCNRARSQASALDSGQRITRINDKGEREVIDDQARADESRRTRAVIASDCK